MSKEGASTKGSSHSTQSKKSIKQHKKIAIGPGDKRSPTPESKDSRDKKCPSRSRKQVKEHHHSKKKDAGGKKDDEKEKKDLTTKNLKKEKKEQNSQLPTEFEEVHAARRPAVSKTKREKRKNLVIEEDADAAPLTPVTGQSSSNVISTKEVSHPGNDEGLPAPTKTPPSNDGKCSGSLDPDSSGRVPPAGASKTGDPESDQSGAPLPGIKLSKELIKHGSNKETAAAAKGSSNKEKPSQPKAGSKETIKPETSVAKTLMPGTPGIMQNLPMLPVDEKTERNEKKQ